MAHNLQETDSMMYVREKPWHGLGVRVEEAPDTETALVLAGLNWGVELLPLPHPAIPGEVIPGHFANTRMTDKRVLGVVGSKYRPVQNRELANLVDGLISEGARIETAGSLGNGARVWLLARMPEEYKLAGDPTTMYLLVSNFHNGWGSVKANVVPVRVVCQNTINLALRQALRSWSCRHTGSVTAKVNEAARALGMVRTYRAELAGVADELAATRVSPDQWTEICKKLLPDPDDAKQAAAVARAKERRQALWNLMLADDLADFRWTAWGAINAVTDFEGHTAPARKVGDWKEARMADLVDKPELLDKAFALLK